MNNQTCIGCGEPLKDMGTQYDVLGGVQYTLMHCDNQECEWYQMTYSYDPRPMDAAKRTQMLQAIIDRIQASQTRSKR